MGKKLKDQEVDVPEFTEAQMRMCLPKKLSKKPIFNACIGHLGDLSLNLEKCVGLLTRIEEMCGIVFDTAEGARKVLRIKSGKASLYPRGYTGLWFEPCPTSYLKDRDIWPREVLQSNKVLVFHRHDGWLMFTACEHSFELITGDDAFEFFMCGPPLPSGFVQEPRRPADQALN